MTTLEPMLWFWASVILAFAIVCGGFYDMAMEREREQEEADDD